MNNNYFATMPRMSNLRAAAKTTGLSYKYLLKLCHENKVAHIRCGRDFKINMDALADLLNNGSSATSTNGGEAE